MKTAIVYKTVSGYTERYAHILRDMLKQDEVTLIPLDKFKPKMLNDCDRAVFMSRVINGSIDGFKTVVKHAQLFASKYTAVVAVGMTKPTDEHYHVVEKANIPYKLKGIPLFVVRGGFDADKLKGGNKMMINMMKTRLVKSPSRTPEEMAMLNFLAAKTDKVDASQLDGLIGYLDSGVFNPPPADTEFPQSEYWADLEEYMPAGYKKPAEDKR